jgi:hypothetical protein
LDGRADELFSFGGATFSQQHPRASVVYLRGMYGVFHTGKEGLRAV